MLLIKNATIFEDSGSRVVDLLIEDKKISKIGSRLQSSNNIKVIDISGKYLLPGIIDLNVRVKDDKFNLAHIERLEKKAKKSGITTFVLMCDFSPKIEDRTTLELLRTKLDSFNIDIRIAIKATKDKNKKSLNNIAVMREFGADVIQEDSFVDGNILRRVLQYTKMKDMPLFCSCDNPMLNDNGVMHEGSVSSKLGLAGVSKVSEISEVAKVALMSEYYDAKTLFQAISTSRSLTLIDEIKKSGKPLYSEVSIAHLLFSDEMCDGFNTLAKIKPPLRDEDERAKLIDAVKLGIIDTITSLHSAKSFNSKDVAFNDASYGIDSLEYLLSLVYTYLVKKEHISMNRAIDLLSTTPAKILKEESLGVIKEGAFANLIVFDPNKRYTIDDGGSLFNNLELYGSVDMTILSGRIL